MVAGENHHDGRDEGMGERQEAPPPRAERDDADGDDQRPAHVERWHRGQLVCRLGGAQVIGARPEECAGVQERCRQQAGRGERIQDVEYEAGRGDPDQGVADHAERWAVADEGPAQEGGGDREVGPHVVGVRCSHECRPLDCQMLQ